VAGFAVWQYVRGSAFICGSGKGSRVERRGSRGEGGGAVLGVWCSAFGEGKGDLRSSAVAAPGRTGIENEDEDDDEDDCGTGRGAYRGGQMAALWP